MFAFDVFGNFDLVCQCQAKRLAAKNISKVTYFVGWDVKPQSTRASARYAGRSPTTMIVGGLLLLLLFTDGMLFLLPDQQCHTKVKGT